MKRIHSMQLTAHPYMKICIALIDISSGLRGTRLLHLNISNVLLLLSLFTDFLLLLLHHTMDVVPSSDVKSETLRNIKLTDFTINSVYIYGHTLNINKFSIFKDLLLYIKACPLWVLRSYLICLSWINAYHKKWQHWPSQTNWVFTKESLRTA